MLFPSEHLRITTDQGCATLWLNFPDEPTHSLDRECLCQLDQAIASVAGIRSIRVLVIRSGRAAGFCTGLLPQVTAKLTHPTERAAFSWYGQQVFDRLATLDVTTVSYVDSPCLDASLELALACDYRLALASPSSPIGFPNRFTGFGGGPRLRELIGRPAAELIASGRTLSAREARDLHLVDRAFCERRARIELHSFLDELQSRRLSPRRANPGAGFAAERRTFSLAGATQLSDPVALQPTSAPTRFPQTVGLWGDDPHMARFAARLLVQGRQLVRQLVIFQGRREPVDREIATWQSRGFLTPLEAQRIRESVSLAPHSTAFRHAELVLVAPEVNFMDAIPALLPRAIVGLIDRRSDPGKVAAEQRLISSSQRITSLFRPQRFLHLSFVGSSAVEISPWQSSESLAASTLAGWLRQLGYTPVIRPTRQPSGQATSRNSHHANDCDSRLLRLG